jgi:hypothetical protein
VQDAASAAAALGRPVRIRGAAANAKLGAVVMRQDLVVYLEGKRAWTDKVVGRKVEATGELIQTARYKSRTSPAGAIVQGTAGAIWLLRRPRWRLVPVPRPVRPSRPVRPRPARPSRPSRPSSR